MPGDMPSAWATMNPMMRIATSVMTTPMAFLMTAAPIATTRMGTMIAASASKLKSVEPLPEHCSPLL